MPTVDKLRHVGRWLVPVSSTVPISKNLEALSMMRSMSSMTPRTSSPMQWGTRMAHRGYLCHAGQWQTRAHSLTVPTSHRGFQHRRQRWVTPAAAAHHVSSVDSISWSGSGGIVGDTSMHTKLTEQIHKGTPNPKRHRQYATKTRDYFSKDDVGVGKAVAYTKKNVAKIAVISSPPFRRLLQVVDTDGKTDKVELKHIENVFECVFPEVGVDSRVEKNVAIDLSNNSGRRSFAKRFGNALKQATTLAESEMEKDLQSDAGVLKSAWEIARQGVSTASATTAIEHPDGSFVRVVSKDETGNPVAAEDLARESFFSTENEKSESEFARQYAAHVLLSSQNGVNYFEPMSKGRFAARALKDVTAIKTRTQEQETADSERSDAWQVLRDAMSLSPRKKPSRDYFTSQGLLSGDSGITKESSLHIARSVKALEAYALGHGRYTTGQFACAKEVLGKLGMRVSEKSARDALIAIGRIDGYEDLSWKRWEVQAGFSHEIESYAEGISDGSITPPFDLDATRRKDLTRLTTYAIDSKDTSEIDDAIGAEQLPDGKIRVWIHVADASRWSPVVEEATSHKSVDGSYQQHLLDQTARHRGASAYGPDGTISMFPLSLAGRNGPMSLGPPGVDKCAMSITAVIDPKDGSVDEYWIGPSVVRLTHSVSEIEAADLLASDPEKHTGLQLLSQVAEKRFELRAGKGAVTIDLPESVCVVDRIDTDNDDDGSSDDSYDMDEDSCGNNQGERSAIAVRALERKKLDISLFAVEKQSTINQIVSEMMILGSELIGKFGEANNLPLPYRGQAENQQNPGTDTFHSNPIVHEMAKRSGMRGASVSTSPRKHHGLGVDTYVQFTSPIRRYLDLLAHAQIKAFLRQRDDNVGGDESLPFDSESMQGLLDEVNESIRDLRSATRDATSFWQIYYFANGGLKKEHTAVIAKWIRKEQRIGVVVLAETGVEKSVKLDAVEKSEKRRALLGDSVILTVKEADPFEARLVFDVVRIEKE